MNLIDCYVTSVMTQPYKKFGHWWVDVKYESEGRPGESKLMFKTKEAADAVKTGHHFLA
ncbi:hypothetical protein [Pseudomonas asplenii]|uniref:hypothetical protein n=1 Tax=Pseudomonas asplenii TaxID=53407 RepID=UPI000382E6D7|nr:hypothetical protein [Pseudomonas fuscovaginae]